MPNADVDLNISNGLCFAILTFSVSEFGAITWKIAFRKMVFESNVYTYIQLAIEVISNANKIYQKLYTQPGIAYFDKKKKNLKKE